MFWLCLRLGVARQMTMLTGQSLEGSWLAPHYSIALARLKPRPSWYEWSTYHLVPGTTWKALRTCRAVPCSTIPLLWKSAINGNCRDWQVSMTVGVLAGKNYKNVSFFQGVMKFCVCVSVLFCKQTPLLSHMVRLLLQLHGFGSLCLFNIVFLFQCDIWVKFGSGPLAQLVPLFQTSLVVI